MSAVTSKMERGILQRYSTEIPLQRFWLQCVVSHATYVIQFRSLLGCVELRVAVFGPCAIASSSPRSLVSAYTFPLHSFASSQSSLPAWRVVLLHDCSSPCQVFLVFLLFCFSLTPSIFPCSHCPSSAPRWASLVLTGPKKDLRLASVVVGDLDLEQLPVTVLMVLLLHLFHRWEKSLQKSLLCQSKYTRVKVLVIKCYGKGTFYFELRILSIRGKVLLD